MSSPDDDDGDFVVQHNSAVEAEQASSSLASSIMAKQDNDAKDEILIVDDEPCIPTFPTTSQAMGSHSPNLSKKFIIDLTSDDLSTNETDSGHMSGSSGQHRDPKSDGPSHIDKY